MAVVSYHDAYLYAADIHLLEPGEWLNDAVITFAMEYLSHEHSTLSQLPEMAFVSPAVVQLCAFLAPHDSAAILGDLLHGKHWIFLPLSDSEDRERANSGCHWTLLVADLRAAPRFYSFDSMSGGVSEKAYAIARRVAAALHASSSSTEIHVQAQSCPQQTNNSDCGAWVISNCERFALKQQPQAKEHVFPTAEATRQHLKVIESFIVWFQPNVPKPFTHPLSSPSKRLTLRFRPWRCVMRATRGTRGKGTYNRLATPRNNAARKRRCGMMAYRYPIEE